MMIEISVIKVRRDQLIVILSFVRQRVRRSCLNGVNGFIQAQRLRIPWQSHTATSRLLEKALWDAATVALHGEIRKQLQLS